MAGARPELIFVAGPQAGQRAVLMNDVSYIGRSPQADVCVQEEFVSRQHVRFALTRDGWVMENVSTSSKISINGKKYKAGKQLILASGDVLGLGAETELLFVEAGDDPNGVLAAYREKNPTPISSTTKHKKPAEPSKVEKAVSEASPIEPVKKARKRKPVKEPASSGEAARKAKYRKYAIGFGIYMVLMIGLFALLMAAKSAKEDQEQTEAPRAWLTGKEISDAIESDLERAPNVEASARSLKNADELFRNRSRTHEKKNLYLCVKNYKLYLAFRRKDKRIFTPGDERNFDTARRELIERFQTTYDNALVAERGHRWADAHNELEELLRYIPVNEATEDPQVKAVIVDNVLEHLRYVSKEMNQKKKKR